MVLGQCVSISKTWTKGGKEGKEEGRALDFYFTPPKKFNREYITALSVKPNTIKLPEEDNGEKT